MGHYDTKKGIAEYTKRSQKWGGHKIIKILKFVPNSSSGTFGQQKLKEAIMVIVDTIEKPTISDERIEELWNKHRTFFTHMDVLEKEGFKAAIKELNNEERCKKGKLY